MGRERRRSGFTIIEVLVALVVGAVVVLGTRMLAEQIAQVGERVIVAAALADGESNGERMLRDLLLRLEVGTEDAAHFAGAPDSSAFWSWCDMARGWRERCTVVIVVGRGDVRDTIHVRTSTGLAFAALDAPAPVSLRYLNDATAGGQWFRSWGAGITAPLAIAVMSARDTTILRIGDRG